MPSPKSSLSSGSPTPHTAAELRSYVRKCFCEALCDVDFYQALRAIEYLAVHDSHRKRAVRGALRRLDVDVDDQASMNTQKDKLRNSCRGAHERVRSIEDKSRKAEALYTQVYIGLRRWV